MKKNRLEKNLDVAIAKGKNLMKGSGDAFHDFRHAKNVERLALEIYKAQPRTKNLVKLIGVTAYWHDAYKASAKRFRLSNSDGKQGSLIAKRELGELLPPDLLSKVAMAIKTHSWIIKYVFFPKSFSLLEQLIIEADMIDMIDIDRWKRGTTPQNMTYLQRVIFSLFELICISLLLPRVFTFERNQQIFKKESKKFWSFFLFKEKYLLKLFLNQV